MSALDPGELRALVIRWREHAARLEATADAQPDATLKHGQQMASAAYARAADDLAPLVGMRVRYLSAAQRAAGLTRDQHSSDYGTHPEELAP